MGNLFVVLPTMHLASTKVSQVRKYVPERLMGLYGSSVCNLASLPDKSAGMFDF